ncbi:MAG: hypothetical protein JWO54_776 [Candidatus Saccharibacteria bacterium]|nr:hypothetical protein [Candidatus Saccharibacteria bacterium]MDB5181013.1 hypothetical protein [Candidatus Saccharibacteria bacterium]
MPGGGDAGWSGRERDGGGGAALGDGADEVDHLGRVHLGRGHGRRGAGTDGIHHVTFLSLGEAGSIRAHGAVPTNYLLSEEAPIASR